MRQRARKFVGTIVLVVFMALYALITMTIASAKLPGTPGWLQLLFFVVAGLLWVVPAAGLVTWMQRPDRTAPP
jgi:hypothetical protein